MATTGVIFGAIAIAWLAYLVPHFVRRRDNDPDDLEIDNRFSDSVRIVRNGTAPLLNQDLEQIETFEVSTPQTRRAAVADIHRLDRLAALRRRRVLLLLIAALSAVIGVCGVQLIPWWSVAAPSSLLLIFVVVARVSVQAMRKSLDARFHSISRGSEEETVFLSIGDKAKVIKVGSVSAGKSEAEIKPPGTLWDPIPITMPTYVSKPLAPRTVRTIDLSGPMPATSPGSELPVIADAPPATETDSEKEPDELEATETQQAATA